MVDRSSASLADSIALGAILVAACTRALIAFAPLPVFDLDPAMDASQFVGGTPADSVALDALALAGAGWLLLRGWWGGSSWKLVAAIAILPAIVLVAVHGLFDAEQLWRGTTWITGALAALALLVRLPAERARVLHTAAVAAIAGVAVVMAMRGLSQMVSEHASMVAYYEGSREEFLQAQGWLPGSPQALAYERRLSQNEPSAWFGFSNVFATAAGAGAVLLANLALARGVAWSARACLLGAVALCAGLVIAGGSKGGVAAIAIGVAVSAIARRKSGAVGWLLVALPFIVILGVVVRGAVGTEWGERSLLFRWQYLVGAAGTFFESPWMGVGPAGFQTAYLTHRPGDSVEEVLSAHGAFADWLIAFGFAGGGLIALQLLMAWRAGRAIALPPPTPEGSTSRSAQEVAVAVVVFAGIISIAFEAPALDGFDAMLWRLGGVGAGVLVAMTVARIVGSVNADAARATAIGLAASAAVILSHGEIDMAFWLPGSALWAWMVLAVAASAWQGGGEDRAPSRRWAARAAAGVAFAMAVALALVVRTTLLRQDRLAIFAAEHIHEGAEQNSAEILAFARAAAADSLVEASNSWLRRDGYAVRASEQWQSAAMLLPNDAMTPGWLRAAVAASRSAEASAPSRFSALLTGSTAAIRAAELRSGSWVDASNAILRVLALNPRHTESWIRLAIALERMGDPSGAHAAIERALESDASYALDPVRQMNEKRRAELRERLARLLR